MKKKRWVVRVDRLDNCCVVRLVGVCCMLFGIRVKIYRLVGVVNEFW